MCTGITIYKLRIFPTGECQVQDGVLQIYIYIYWAIGAFGDVVVRLVMCLSGWRYVCPVGDVFAWPGEAQENKTTNINNAPKGEN